MSMSSKLVLLIVGQFFSIASCCERLSEDDQSVPTRICSVKVTVSRRSSCFLFFRETFVFPFTNSSHKFLRQIPIHDEQGLTNVEATTGGNKLDVNIKEEPNSVLVEIETVTTEKVIEYGLSYAMHDGVMVATTEGCGVIPNEDLPLQGNVWRWATGDWGYNVSSLEVSFQSKNESRKLSAIGAEFESEELADGSLRFNVTRTRGGVQIFALESGKRNSCSSPLRCLRTEGEEAEESSDGFFGFVLSRPWWQWVIFGALVAFAFACVISSVRYCWRRCCGERHAPTRSALHHPVKEVMSMEERRARHVVHESEKEEREKQARRKREQQQWQQLQMQQITRASQHDDQLRRDAERKRRDREQRERERQARERAARERAARQRAAAQRRGY